MRRPVALPGDRLSPLATAGLDRWPFKTELGLQTPLTFAAAPALRARPFNALARKRRRHFCRAARAFLLCAVLNFPRVALFAARDLTFVPVFAIIIRSRSWGACKRAPALPARGEYWKQEVQRVYAVIQTGGKQYRVQQGDVIFVEKLDVQAGDAVKFDQVLFVGGDEAKIGTPVVAGASVEGKVLAQVKGQKIVVYKYKAKKNERKKQGHRQPYTKVEIGKITF